MRLLILFMVAVVIQPALTQESATKRQALRALDAAYNSVLNSDQDLNYQQIIELANEVSAMTEGSGLICAHNGGGWYHLYDRSEDKNLSSSSMKLQVCERVIKSARSGLVCAHNGGDWFHLYDRRAKKTLTTSTDVLGNCVAVIQDSKNGFVCVHQGGGWYHLYDRASGKKVSRSSMPYGECARSIP